MMQPPLSALFNGDSCIFSRKMRIFKFGKIENNIKKPTVSK